VANDLTELLPQSDFVVADKGYDNEAIRKKIREQNSSSIIPRKQNSKQEMMILIDVCINTDI